MSAHSVNAQPVDPVNRWQRGLVERVGMTEGEAKRLLDRLHEFCHRHGTDPDSVLADWQAFPELTVRRRQSAQAAELAVESFLVHNGVNVFGDIVCVPSTPEDLATQGARFDPRSS